MAAVEDILNQALREVGYARPIAEIYEGSRASRVAIEIYGQTRDELMRATDWSFSRKVLSLTLLKGPPPDGGYSIALPWSTIYPYPGFLYEYAYPSDCLDLRAIIGPPGVMPDSDPVPQLWRVDNDPVPIVTPGNPPTVSGPPQKVILANQTSALAVYRASITDPTTWSTDFVQAIVGSLAQKFAAAFGIDLKKVEQAQSGEMGEAAVAEQNRG